MQPACYDPRTKFAEKKHRFGSYRCKPKFETHRTAPAAGFLAGLAAVTGCRSAELKQRTAGLNL
jgi:hypothetical protein